MSKKNKINQIILTVILAAIALMVIIPFVILVSVSFSEEKDILRNGYNIIPRVPSLNAYRYVLKNPDQIIQAYKVTIFFSIVATFFSVMLMSMLAYVLTRNDYKPRKVMNFMLFFTMLFGGGLVPTYILMTRYLNIDNTILVYILPHAVSAWYVFMLRTFFKGLPDGIVEAAMIDGAGQWRVFLTIIIPLSKPVIATVSLLTFLGKWNIWFESMLYIQDQDLVSLQYYLQRIMRNIQLLREVSESGGTPAVNAIDVPGETAKMAMAVLVAGPALFVFPFFQKYFVKGLTVGGVKG